MGWPQSKVTAPFQEEERDTDTQGDGHVMMEAATAVMRPQAEDSRSPKSFRRQEGGALPRLGLGSGLQAARDESLLFGTVCSPGDLPTRVLTLLPVTVPPATRPPGRTTLHTRVPPCIPLHCPTLSCAVSQTPVGHEGPRESWVPGGVGGWTFPAASCPLARSPRFLLGALAEARTPSVKDRHQAPACKTLTGPFRTAVQLAALYRSSPGTTQPHTDPYK